MGTATATARRRATRADASMDVAAPPPQVAPADPTVLTARVLANGIVVLDYDRSTYMALSREGDYWHQMRPGVASDWVVREGHRRVGQLICNCESGRVRGACYRVSQAEAYEAEQADERAWAAMWADEVVAS